MPLINSLGANIVAAVRDILCVAVILWGIERLFPKGKVSIASQLRALKFWMFAALGTAVATTLYKLVGNALPQQPLIVVPLRAWLGSPWIHWSLYVVSPILAIILFDFFGYWLHRAQHRWLWRQHSIHHSIEELSGINSYFHWTEQFFRIAFISLPAAYLVGIDGVTTVVSVELLVHLQGYYLHSQSSLHFGPIIRRVIADNRFHRIHHSLEAHHFDKNFGAGTSVWDQVFGTAYFPADKEWPATGLADQPEARTINEFLWRPFRRPAADNGAISHP